MGFSCVLGADEKCSVPCLSGRDVYFFVDCVRVDAARIHQTSRKSVEGKSPGL